MKTLDQLPSVLQQRFSTHGRFSDNARLTEQIMDVLRSSPNWDSCDPCVKVATFMIIHKLARALSGSVLFDDHWKDIAGYATLIVDSIQPPK